MRKRVLSLLFVLAFITGFMAVPAAALSVPNRPANNYVLDQANVLSAEAEQQIISVNQVLFKSTGAEVVVAAVDFISGNDIGDYANELFNDWGIGSAQRNNGLLLILAIAEDNYYVLPGSGINGYFTGNRLSNMLQDDLQADFEAGNYEKGVLKFVDDANSQLTAYYQTHTDQYSGQNTTFETNGSGRSMFSGFLNSARTVTGLIVFVVVLLFLIRAFSRGGGGGGGYGGGGGGNFWTGMFLGSMFGGRRRNRGWGAPPPPGGWGGPPGGGFGGFSGGGRSNGGGAGRGGFGGGGGFSGGGRSSGGGVGKR